MSRISYRCLPDERRLPVAQRTQWDVYIDGRCVGCIKADTKELNQKRSHSLRVWRPSVNEKFNSFEFPHAEDDDDVSSLEEPYILTNDDEEVDHNLELHHPTLMTMAEARTWVRSALKGE